MNFRFQQWFRFEPKMQNLVLVGLCLPDDINEETTTTNEQTNEQKPTLVV